MPLIKHCATALNLTEWQNGRDSGEILSGKQAANWQIAGCSCVCQ